MELHDTVMGHRFFQQTMPSIEKSLKRIADALERMAKVEEQMGAMAGEMTANRTAGTPNVEAAIQILKDNGIEEDEAETVLQALGYALFDEELLD